MELGEAKFEYYLLKQNEWMFQFKYLENIKK